MDKTRAINPKNDLTQGPITSKIIMFALPMIASNLVMQLYNVVDSVVVGQFVSGKAVGAVGVSFPIMMLFNALFMGVSMGSNIITSQMFGAKNMEGLKKSVNTSIFLAFAMGIVITVGGLIFSRPLLNLMNTPADIIEDSTIYLMIVFGGTLGNVFFSLGSGALRGMGDSRWPLIAMIISCFLNIVLDLLFVVVFNWGVAGVAWATLIATLVSGLVLLWRINTGNYGVKITVAQVMKPDGISMKNILKLGLPTGLQSMAMSLGTTVIQSFANNFGSDFITANTVIMKADGFAIMPIMGLGMSTTTFVGQNVGAGLKDRAKKGIYTILGMVAAISVVMGVILWFTGPTILKVFNVSDHVLEIGLHGIRFICFFYAFMGIDGCLSGAMRGSGVAVMPMITAISANMIRIPVTYFLAVVPLNKAIQAAVDAGQYATFELAKAAGVGMDGYMPMFHSIAIGMGVGALLIFLYFIFGKWQNKGVKLQQSAPPDELPASKE